MKHIIKQDPDDPSLAFSPSDKIGRLYRKPGTPLPQQMETEEIREKINTGLLFPSATNIISVKNSPFLIPWATKLVASKAVDLATKQPEWFIQRCSEAPTAAINYLKETANRERDFWGGQGSKLHLVFELLAKNESIEHFEFTDYETSCVNVFKTWLDTYQPEFEHAEITGFGQTEEKQLGYAFTTDAIMKINGKRYIGDYKCVTDDTPILMANGATKRADEIIKGDQVVAWNENRGLHISEVSYAGDNGFHKVTTITTSTGHKVTTTLNHPFWSSSKESQIGWVKAENLRVGDNVYVASGWNYSNERIAEKWTFNKNFSPYLFGMLWSLRNFKSDDWETQMLHDLPKISRETLHDELKGSGFYFNKAGQLNISKGFDKIAKKSKSDKETILNLINTTELPDFLYTAHKDFLYAFFSGVKEVFLNKEINKDNLFVIGNRKALVNLQQLLINYGQPAVLQSDRDTGMTFLKTPLENDKTIYSHGPTVTRITSIEIQDTEEHTIAIEVKGAHTHVTGGIITHNTNRSGLHLEVGMQLAAGANGKEIVVNDKLEPMPEIHGGLGLHISPNGVRTEKVNISNEVMEEFSALRTVWDSYAFEDSRDKNKVFLGTVQSPSEL